MSENASVGHAEISSEQNTGLPTAVYVTELFYDEALLPHKTALLQLKKLAHRRLCYVANY